MAKGCTRRYTQQQVIEAIRQNHGFITYAAKSLGCVYQTIGNYARRFPKVQEALDDEREVMLDMAEQKLFEQIKDGVLMAVIYYLNNQGKKRGYNLSMAQSDFDVPPPSKIVFDIKASDTKTRPKITNGKAKTRAKNKDKP